MSKGIFLYSEDKKYKCAFELSDTLDKYQIPDHSVMILFEEREDGDYVIAEARDKILTTEKDLLIASLELEKSDLVRENMELASKVDLLESEKENLFRTLEEANEENQDKIAFAVEQLERALDIVENGLDDALKNISFNASYYNKILDKLDQLIAEIKGE